MNRRLVEIADRRNRLIVQIAGQRQVLGEAVAPWRLVLEIGDQAHSIARFVHENRAMVACGVVLFAFLRRGPAGRWLRRGWIAWRILEGVRKRGRYTGTTPMRAT